MGMQGLVGSTGWVGKGSRGPRVGGYGGGGDKLVGWVTKDNKINPNTRDLMLRYKY